VGVHPPTIRAGCCGFALPQAEYFRQFSCIEIDTSFYQLPKLKTVTRWAPRPRRRTSGFALKAWQVITQSRKTSPTYKRTRLERPRPATTAATLDSTPPIRWAWDETFAVAKELGAFFVLFKCPASFTPNHRPHYRAETFLRESQTRQAQLWLGNRAARGSRNKSPRSAGNSISFIVVDPLKTPLNGRQAAVLPAPRCYRCAAPVFRCGTRPAPAIFAGKPRPVIVCLIPSPWRVTRALCRADAALT